jgi:hypothetical protein
MTDAIILHAHLRLPLSCPSWQPPLLRALPYAQRLELERREPEARRASLAGLGLRAAGEVALADRLGHAVVRRQRYQLQWLDEVPGVICHIAARRKLTPIIAPVELDDALTSVLLERSLGLAAQFG